MKGVIIFILALSVIDLTLTAEFIETNPKNNTTISVQEAKKKCSERSIEYANAGDNVRETFSEAVKLALESKHPDAESALDKLNAALSNFLNIGNKTCKNGTMDLNTYNFSPYLNITKCSLKNATTLKGLRDDGVFQCINKKKHAIQTKIDECVVNVNKTKSETKANITYNGALMLKSSLKFSFTACNRNIKKKNCTQSAMNRYCGDVKSRVKIVEFVGSLFDCAHQYCSPKKNNTDGKSASDKVAGLTTTLFALTIFLITKLLRRN